MRASNLTRRPAYVSDGDDVLFPHGGTYAVGRVTTAMGDVARVSCPRLGIDTWFRTDELLVENLRDGDV